MTQKSITSLLTAAVVTLAFAGAGCSSTAGNPQFANQDRNLLNLVKIQPHSFAYSDPSTFELRSNDVITQPNVSGTKVSLLCGLFTFEDY